MNNDINVQSKYFEYKHKLNKKLKLFIISFLVGCGLGLIFFVQSPANTQLVAGLISGLVVALIAYTWGSIPVLALGWIAVLIKLLVVLISCVLFVPINFLIILFKFLEYRHAYYKK